MCEWGEDGVKQAVSELTGGGEGHRGVGQHGRPRQLQDWWAVATSGAGSSLRPQRQHRALRGKGLEEGLDVDLMGLVGADWRSVLAASGSVRRGPRQTSAVENFAPNPAPTRLQGRSPLLRPAGRPARSGIASSRSHKARCASKAAAGQIKQFAEPFTADGGRDPLAAWAKRRDARAGRSWPAGAASSPAPPGRAATPALTLGRAGGGRIDAYWCGDSITTSTSPPVAARCWRGRAGRVRVGGDTRSDDHLLQGSW